MQNLGANLSSLRIGNRREILYALNEHLSLSRISLSEKINLTPSSITILINKMVEEGIVVERRGASHGQKKASGRPEVQLAINYDFAKALGIYLSSNIVSLCVTNLDYQVVCQKDLPPAEFEGNSDALMERVLEETRLLLERYDGILGVGVAVAGRVNVITGELLDSHGMLHDNINLVRLFRERLNVNVVIDDNVRALAMAEYAQYIKNRTVDLFFVKYGPGLGSAILLNGVPLYGETMTAGELGHMTLPNNQDLCRCGKRGCLETYVCENRIKGVLGENDIAAAYQRYMRGDPAACQLIDEILETLALSISNATVLLNPSRIVLYGTLFKIPRAFLTLKYHFSRINPSIDADEFMQVSRLELPATAGAAICISQLFYAAGGQSAPVEPHPAKERLANGAR